MTARLSAALAAEWTKLTSTRMFVTCAALAFGFSVVLTGLLAFAMASAEEVCSKPGRNCHSDPLRPDVLVSTAGFLGDNTPGPGLATLMVLAALTMSVEHRYKTIGTTFMTIPRRWVVLAAKTLIAMAVGLTVGALSILGSAAAFGALGGKALGAFHLTSDLAVRMYVTVPVVAMLAAALAVAVGSIARNSVVAVTVVVTWPGILEPLLSSFPGVGSHIAPALPFVNARNFIGLDGPDLPWPWLVSGAYLAVFAVVVVVLALVHQARTDVTVS